MRLDEFLIEKKIKPRRIITEAKEKPVKVVILSLRPENPKNEYCRTAGEMKKILDKKGIENYVSYINDCYITNEEDIKRIHNVDDKKGFIIDSSDTAVIVRGGGMQTASGRNIVTQIERSSIYTINSRDCIEVCSDKYRTVMVLSDQSIMVPKTSMVKSLDSLDEVFENVGGEFPIILKTLFGSRGIGVFFADSMRALRSMLQTIWKISPEEEILIQQYIKIKYDVRAHVLGGKCIAAMKRYVIEDDFRSNFSQGGKVENIKLTDDQIEICEKAASVVGGQWVGVDFVEDKNGIYVIEINSSPGTSGIEQATKKNISLQVVDFCLDRDNWIKKTFECGYKEYIDVPEIDYNIVAKFDTGNGGYSVMHADKMEVSKKGMKVSIWINDKKIVKDVIRIMKVNLGGLRDYMEERPLVVFDIIFNGVNYKDIEFTLDNRGKKSPILMNRNFMRRANISVNPLLKFKLTSLRKA